VPRPEERGSPAAVAPAGDQLGADCVRHLERPPICPQCSMISLMAVFRFATQRSGSPAHLPSALSTAAPVRPMSAGPSPPAFQAAQLRTRTLRQRTRVVLDVGRHVTARLGDEVKLLDHTRSLRRRADRQPSRHHWVDRARMRRFSAIRSAPSGCELARMVSARKIACHEPDPNVTTQSSVVWPWAGTRQTDAGNQLLPLDTSTGSAGASSGRTASGG
jgi:hypothetical protein